MEHRDQQFGRGGRGGRGRGGRGQGKGKGKGHHVIRHHGTDRASATSHSSSSSIFGGALSSSANVTMASSSTKTVTEKVALEIPIKKLVFVVLDVSGSMAGSRLPKALSCIGSLILGDVCTDTDHFALIAFNDTVHTVTPRRPKYAVKWSAVSKKVTSLCGGRTCLWGAVLQAMGDLSNMSRAKGVHVDLVVLTDGDDNRSRPGSVDELEAWMAKPGMANFHAIFLACCGASTADMHRIAANKKHVRVIEEASSGPDSITKAFGRAQQVLIERRSTTITTHCGSNSSSCVSTTTTQECSVMGSNGKAVAGLTDQFGGMGFGGNRQKPALTNGQAKGKGKGYHDTRGQAKGKGKGKGRPSHGTKGKGKGRGKNAHSHGGGKGRGKGH